MNHTDDLCLLTKKWWGEKTLCRRLRRGQKDGSTSATNSADYTLTASTNDKIISKYTM